MLEQVPLIELELKLAKVNKNDLNRQNSRKRRSKRNRADESNKERVSKWQRRDSKSNLVLDPRTYASTAKERKS